MKHLKDILYPLLNQQAGQVRMSYLRETLHTLLDQQAGQIQLFIIVPILTLSLLSLIVRTASSAVDPVVEKRKVAEQLRRRLSEVEILEEYLLVARNPTTVLPNIVSPLPVPVIWRTTYGLDRRSPLLSAKQADGGVSFRRETPPTTLLWRAIGGRIKSTLHEAAVKAGVPLS
ncbi:MAG: hypothetical protein ACRERD_07750, partial [Candidatus Binatia bacterium]